MQIARNGQSWQSLCFCFSGQQGMSPDMAAICISASDALFPAAIGDANGAMANPTATSTANRSFGNRDPSMEVDILIRVPSVKALTFTSSRHGLPIVGAEVRSESIPDVLLIQRCRQ